MGLTTRAAKMLCYWAPSIVGVWLSFSTWTAETRVESGPALLFPSWTASKQARSTRDPGASHDTYDDGSLNMESDSALLRAKSHIASAEMGPKFKEAMQTVLEYVKSTQEKSQNEIAQCQSQIERVKLEFQNKLKQVTAAIQELTRQPPSDPLLQNCIPAYEVSTNPDEADEGTRSRRSADASKENNSQEQSSDLSPDLPQQTTMTPQSAEEGPLSLMGNSGVHHIESSGIRSHESLGLLKQLETRVGALEVSSRRTSLRSCHGLKETGVSKSGKYVIDPDGVDTGQPPIEVYCDFSGSDAMTVIPHADVNKTLSVERCSTPGCFRYDAQYSVPLGQINALVDLSTSCFQEVKYECFHAPLTAYGFLHNAWWVGRGGVEKYYWSGLHSDNHVCACGLAGNCTMHTALQCNCDSSAPEWLADHGVLQDKNSLPVVSLHFGGLKYPMQDARFSLGPLSCSGMDADARKLDSCLALKKAGHRSPGYYMLDSSKQDGPPASRVAKCNLDLDPTDPKFEEDADANLSPPPIIFSVQGSDNLKLDYWTPISYDVHQVAFGGGMDLTTGTFTSPVNGVFYFTFNAYKESRNLHYFEAKLVKNGMAQVGIAYSSVYNDNGYGRSLTLSATVQMFQNDTITVLGKGHFTGNNGRPIQFMGHLLTETQL